MQGSVIFSISSVQDVHPISPLIYGVIQVNLATSPTYSLKISVSTSQHSITQLLGPSTSEIQNEYRKLAQRPMPEYSVGLDRTHCR
jgi:hypothetical protein